MRLLLACLVLVMVVMPATASEMLIPEEQRGEVVYVAYPVLIELDGVLDDWQQIPFAVVERGPMPARTPGENSQFRFALAADDDFLYVAMTTVDATIITGMHGTQYWNEDSLEIFLNFGEDLNRTQFGDGVFQININPGDAGNTDPDSLTLTGQRSQASDARGFVFLTEDGWGFELAIPLPESFIAEHGAPFGFQAQANGATSRDRDVKLSWSLLDVNDQSWQDPAVFGTALIFETGRADIPEVTRVTAPIATETEPGFVSVNQLGYLPDAPKYGVLASDLTRRLVWSLADAQTGEMLLAGFTGDSVFDEASGWRVHVADFSSWQTPGMYTLMIDNVRSPVFEISSNIYDELASDALAFFYHQRSGIAIEAELVGEDWARDAGHLSDNAVTCYQGTDASGREWPGCDYVLDASGGWYDAGDYGKYVVNGGLSVWMLMNLYEHSPNAFPDGRQRIPERDNGVPDLLDESRWQMNFMLGMQVPEGQELAGMVHHKLHSLMWDPLPSRPKTEQYNDDENASTALGRYVYAPSTAATLNLAATAAQCSRIWRDLDAAFSRRCLSAALRAWDAAQAHPELLAGDSPGTGGGNYSDSDPADEFFWAAAELYITTGESSFLDVLSSPDYGLDRWLYQYDNALLSWQSTNNLGLLSLVLHRADLPEELAASLEPALLWLADRYLAAQAENAYGVPLPPDGFQWGSNHAALVNAMALAYAYDLSQDEIYLNGLLRTMDYILGLNPVGQSYVSGYGSTAMQYPHHRFWANDMAIRYPPPPPGALAGGPNANPEEPFFDTEAMRAAGPARRYVDRSVSYSTNEVAINWNASLVWVASYLQKLAEVDGSEE